MWFRHATIWFGVKCTTIAPWSCQHLSLACASLIHRPLPGFQHLREKWPGDEVKCIILLLLEKKKITDPDVIRTRNLLIWSQTHYHCATESTVVGSLLVVIKVVVIFICYVYKQKYLLLHHYYVISWSFPLDQMKSPSSKLCGENKVTQMWFGDNLLVCSQMHYRRFTTLCNGKSEVHHYYNWISGCLECL